MESQGKSATPMNDNCSEARSSADSSENSDPRKPVEVIRLGELFSISPRNSISEQMSELAVAPWKPINNAKKTAKKEQPAKSMDRRSKSKRLPSIEKGYPNNENFVASAIDSMHHHIAFPFVSGAGMWRYLVSPIRKSSESVSESSCFSPRNAMRSPSSSPSYNRTGKTSRRSLKGQELETVLVRGARKRSHRHGKMMRAQESTNALSRYGRSNKLSESTVAERENDVKEAIKYCRKCYYESGSS